MCWRGAAKSYGYLNDSDGTRAVWAAEGWYHSGDLGERDAEGYLRIVGRKKDMIIRGGRNINPRAIEEVLIAHPSVLDVAVVAVPDPVLGERVCAVVMPSEAMPVPRLEDLAAMIRDRGMAAWYQPEQLVLVVDFPRNAGAKIDKAALTRMASKAAGAPGPCGGRSESVRRRSMGATTRLAEFIVKSRWEDLPSDALDAVKRAILDSVGVMLAGSVEPPARIIQRLAGAEGEAPRCTVLGTPFRTSGVWAALTNGTAGHALDFDDTNFAMMGHPSVPVLAAALAAGELGPANGRAFLHAFLLGFEVETALGEVVNPEQYRRGFHATCTLGTLGAAAAAVKLLELDPVQARHALAIAASQASGLKENLGTMTKPFHAGHAARSGVLAALLAREGFTGSEVALEGPQGYLRVLGTRTEDPTAALDRLGAPWKILTSGVAVKLYPSCAATHALIDAVLELRSVHRLRAEQISEIMLGAAPAVPKLLIYHKPRTGLEGKFSAEFCAAAALVDGDVGVAAFTDAKVADPRIRAVMEKVRLMVDPTIPVEGKRDAWGRVTVRLTDGRTLEVPPREIRGHPRLPLSQEALRAKFDQCAAVALPPDRVGAAARMLETLENCGDLRVLTALLGASSES